MTIIGGMKSGSFLSIFIGFPVFVAATVGVLMMMDLLECFLHTLRLHW
jgi:V-type H+-transporting ATPase subunit a